MNRPCWPVGLCAVCLLLGLSRPAPASDPPAAFLERLWAITDTVLDHQVDAPARQAMLLGAVRSAYRAAGEAPPVDLSRRVSAITTREQLGEVLRDVWPRLKDDPTTAILQGALSSLPGRASLITDQERRILDQTSGNRYVGTGIQLRMDVQTNRPQIMIPIRGGPAHKAGIKTGDLILAVDARSTQGEKLNEVVERIRGEEGSDVTFTVRQPDSDEARDVKMTRGVVPFEHVVGFRPGKNDAWEFRIAPEEPIGYVRIKSITSSIVHELREADRQVRAEGLRAVVLDLRYSHGYRMQHAALAADALLDGGTLWRVRDAAGRVKEYKADRDCLFRDLPIVAVINPTSAGESVPLLAAALQDNKRAVFVGESSGFGGFVTGLVEVPGGHGTLSLRTGQVERIRAVPRTVGEADNLAMGWRVDPEHTVQVSRKEFDAIIEWLQDKDQLEPKLADKPPADAQLARAVELLRETLKKTAPTTR